MAVPAGKIRKGAADSMIVTAEKTEQSVAKKPKILLVEDSKTQANFVVDYLEKTGYEVIWAEDGKSAIKIARTTPIDLILLDLILPGISGSEVCRWLKQYEDTKGIPIIMLTIKGSVKDRVAGLEVGADDYLPKPYKEIELNARIYACLRTKILQDELKKKNMELEQKNMQLNILNSKVEILSVTDHLTEVYNRRKFEDVLKKEFAKTVRYNTPVTCLIIDIDLFKRINDTYGHHIGDIVLKETAHILKSTVRVDIDTVARWGGEEFILLFPMTDKKNAVTSATRILREISDHRFPEIPDERITVSIGIASAPDPDAKMDNEEKLIHAADTALYAAKNNGRNRIEIS